MNYYRNNVVAISREAMTMLRWRATAENQTRDKMDPQASVDKLADSIILEWFERHLPQLKHKLALRQQLDDEAVAAAAKLSPVASQPTNQSLSVAHNAHRGANMIIRTNPDMNKLVVRLLRTEPPIVDVCHYAAARIEELEAEVAKRDLLIKEMSADDARIRNLLRPYMANVDGCSHGVPTPADLVFKAVQELARLRQEVTELHQKNTAASEVQ